MKNRDRLIFLALACFVSLALGCYSKSDEQSPVKPEDRSEWIALFDGKSLDGWTPKFAGYPVGENFRNIFRVREGLLEVTYEDSPEFKGEFGHLFYKTPFSHYIIRAEFRFVGEQATGGPRWAFRNNGLMLHSQAPESMDKDQPFPTSIEVQFLGSEGEILNRMGNACTPGTHIVMDGELIEEHVIQSSSGHFFGDQWVTVEAEVHGSGEIIHRVNGVEVLRYEQPQFHDGTLIEGGYIAIQAESFPTQFRKIEILPLKGNRTIWHDGRTLQGK